jgi:hypothetical protein
MDNVLDTTFGDLPGDAQDQQALKDPVMLKRLNDISTFSTEEQENILFALEALIKSVKLKSL